MHCVFIFAGISIHALLAESDLTEYGLKWLAEISIHALLAESDFNLHVMNAAIIAISIHALLAESDAAAPAPGASGIIFLSTLSLRRATDRKGNAKTCKSYFYPRSPCGERRTTTITICTVSKFLSTLSLRRATCPSMTVLHCKTLFLSTLSLRRATKRITSNFKHPEHFYPRSPCGERPSSVRLSLSGSTISIHALLAESDQGRNSQNINSEHISIHALLAESDQQTAYFF